ncbi:hypothetical protein IQ07DRAFT_626972, partial [Pyrenochaeta sp. DS3sAY3a]
MASRNPDLGHVILDHLESLQSYFLRLCPPTPSDLRKFADTLSTTANIVQEVAKELESREDVFDPEDAEEKARRIKCALEWVEFLAKVNINPIPTERTLLFRAHEHRSLEQPLVYKSPAREVVFDEDFRDSYPVRRFLTSLARHLRKTEKERQQGKKLTTKFTSISPILEWTLHLSGRKARGRGPEGPNSTSLVVFDLQKLSEAPNVTVIKISDIIDFLEQGQCLYTIIPKQYLQWARNCDEYVLMGEGIENCVIQMIPWSELDRMPIVQHPFNYADTLGQYHKLRELMDERSVINIEKACDIVVESARTLAGREEDNTEYVLHIAGLILKPGMRFWGFKPNIAKSYIMDRCKGRLQSEL